MSLRQFTPPSFLPAFTHRPGMKIALPGSSHVVAVYPTALRLYTCRPFDVELVKEITFPELGPLSGWVVFIDSMRQTIQVEGKGGQGFVRYRVYTSQEGVFLKPVSGSIKVAANGVVTEVQKSEPFVLVEEVCLLPRFPTPRLLLGCNKAPNWDRISENPTMVEVLPLWYQQSLPSAESSIEPSSTLLGAVFEAVEKKDTSTILSAFATFFRAGIDGFFVPKRTDDLFLGYVDPLMPDEMALTQLHPTICGLIRSLFLREMGNIIDVLPSLPKELVCGRLLHDTLLSGHQIDIEWRKGQVRRVLLHAAHDGMVTIKANAKSASLRLLCGKARKRVFTIGTEIEVQEGKHYLLDNFST